MKITPVDEIVTLHDRASASQTVEFDEADRGPIETFLTITSDRRLVSLWTEEIDSSGGGLNVTSTHLTPHAARQLAAHLVEMADQIEEK